MSLSGMDVAGVRQLAGQFSKGGELLDVLRASVRSGLHSLVWEGADAAVFRDSWERSHGPALSSVAAALQEASQHLLRQAADQLDASGESAGGVGGAALLGGVGAVVGAAAAGGAGRSGGPVPFPGRDLLESGKRLVDGVDAGVDRALKDYGGGGWAEAHDRWIKSHADDLNRWFTADNARKLDRFGRWLGPVGVGFDTGLGGYDQWHQDADQGYSDGERLARAVGGGAVVGGVGLGVGYVGGVAGGAAGGVIGGAIGSVVPIAGTAAGAAVGTAVGAAAGSMAASAAFDWADDRWQLNDQLSDAGAWATSVAWDAGSAAIEVGGDMLESGADLLGDVGSGVADLVDDWSPW